LRVYHCVPGRLRLITVRHDHAEAVGEARHQQAGFWTTLVGDRDLTYFLK
jgi:hypothetical protein